MRYKIMHSKMLDLCKINRFALSVSGALDNKIDQKKLSHKLWYNVNNLSKFLN